MRRARLSGGGEVAGRLGDDLGDIKDILVMQMDGKFDERLILGFWYRKLFCVKKGNVGDGQIWDKCYVWSGCVELMKWIFSSGGLGRF